MDVSQQGKGGMRMNGTGCECGGYISMLNDICQGCGKYYGVGEEVTLICHCGAKMEAKVGEDENHKDIVACTNSECDSEYLIVKLK